MAKRGQRLGHRSRASGVIGNNRIARDVMASDQDGSTAGGSNGSELGS